MQLSGKLRTVVMAMLVVAAGAECGPPRGPDEADDRLDDADWTSPEPGGELSFEDETWPPEPPEVYVGSWEKKGPRPDDLVAADGHFEKKNYKHALKAYDEFIKDSPKNYWVPYATFQKTRCHYQLSEYDQALDVYDAFLEGEPGLLWEARAKVKLSSLYHTLPTSGFRRDDRIYYNYEHNEGEYVYLYQENRQKAVSMLEDARLAYLSLLDAGPDQRGASEGDDVRLEAVDLDFLLIQDIETVHYSMHDTCPPQAPIDPPDPDATYDPHWSAREKTLYLMDEIPRFNEGRDDSHPAAWATFKKALFLMRFPECPPRSWHKKMEKEQKAWESALREKWEDDKGKSAQDVELEMILEDLKEPHFRSPWWDPGPDLDPMSILDRIIDTWPDDRHHELYVATRGRVLEGRQELREAEKLYERFLKDHPDSIWTGDVRYSLFNLRSTSLSTSVQELSYPDSPTRVAIYTRNLKKVKVDVYSVDLVKQMLKNKHLKDEWTNFNDLGEYFKKYKHAAKQLKKKVHSAEYVTKDQGDYRQVYGYYQLPDLPLGQYFIHVHAGNHDYIEPWVKTDLVILGKSVKDEFRYVVTDAVTGEPRSQIPLVVKEVYEKRYGSYKYKYVVKITNAKTDGEGRYTYETMQGSDISYNRVSVLARKGKRIAMTDDYSGPYWHGSDTGLTYRIFTTTDRPVYRPGDTIKFKHIVRAYEKGKNQHIKGVKVHVQVTDPKGDRLMEKTVKASEFGNVWGEVEVPEEAALGVYHADAWVEDHQYRCYQSSGSTFRVEEYKKPEFEVQVLPSQSLATAGDDVKARIKATYYFGAPVANAKVSYKIFRSVFHHTYSPPSRWDWLYGPGYGIVHDRPYAYGEDLIDEGEGRTDDLGELLVNLPRVEEQLKHDYTYRVVADVTDLSRRVISGAGNLKVTRDPYYTYIVPTQGFYTAGDRVEVEVLAMTPDDEPVPAKGTLKVLKLEYPVAEEVKEIEIDSKKLTLDAAGRAFHTFEAKKEGQYRVVFTSTHDGSDPVVGEKLVNVAGEKLSAKHFKFSGVEVTSQKRTYLRGETVKMFVQSPWEDATLWITYEGGDEIFHDQVYRPQGKGIVLEVEATEQLHPNFFVRVTAVRDGSVHTVTREMFIPPGEEILDVKVQAGKEEYKPRSRGDFQITVKDHQGKPVEGEFSISVFDRSVLYIQGETGGDIRSYYYGDRRYNDIREFHSAQIWMYGWSRDRTKYPTFDTYGLPDSGGYFYGAYVNRSHYYTCPSCQQPGKSPWRLVIPAMEKQKSHGSSTSPGGGEMAADPLAGNGGGGMGQLKVMEQSVAPEESEAESSGKKAKKKSPAKPSASPAHVSGAVMAKAEYKPEADKDGLVDEEYRNGGGGADADMVRENFADTALWVPDVLTDEKGKATVDIEWPDNLTTWAVRVVGVDGKTRVGLASTSTITTKKLVARIETPRFMVEGDSLTLAAVVHNDYPDDRDVKLALELTGGVEYGKEKTATITVPSGKDARYDFHIRAVEASEVSVKLTAVTEDDSDALIKRLEVMEWGSDKMVTRMGALRDSGKMTLTLDLPEERRKDTTEFVLALDPSVAGVVLQSMPYLIHYPYGCVEQTMSRFLPAAMVARTLKDLGIKLDQIPKLASKATLADPVGAAHGSPQTWMNAPIYDDAKLDKIIKMGLKRLTSFQHADGGWAWWKEGPSDPYMTAYVVSGLWEAKEAGYNVDTYVVNRGMQFLDRRYEKMHKRIEKKVGWDKMSASERHLMTYMAYVLSLDKRIEFEKFDGIYAHREALSHYGRSLLALALHQTGETDKAKLAVQNLADVTWADDANGTASFKFEAKDWWSWYNNRVETVSWALRAFTAIAPKHEYGPMFARWLVNNRQGNRWFSTRDTALAMLALNDYMTAHDEFDPDYDVTVKVNGKQVLAYHQGKKNIFSGQGRVILRGDDIQGGKLKVQVQTEGKGAIYANAFLSYFTKEKVIEGAGNEIFVERHYYRLEEVKKKVKTWHGEVTKIDYKRHELEPGDSVDSGDLIQVRILIESKNDYEYLVFEDYKPAGFEPIELKSGGIYQHGTWINREMRDEKVVNFLYSLEQGKQALTYKMRAEIPGDFRVLPHKAYAMYAPRVKAISDSWQISIAP